MARETIRVEGLSEVLQALRGLPPEIVSKAGGPVKLALKRAADVLLQQAKANVRAIIDTPNASGEDESTGLLLLSLRAARMKKPAWLRNGEAYAIGVKPGQKYPAAKQSKKGDVNATQVGRLLEYGNENRAPMPWLRPAFDARKGEAIDTFNREVTSRTQKIIKKLENVGARRR